MSLTKVLRNRRDVNNADIPEIIERAERLRQQRIAERELQKNKSSIKDVQSIGKDLSIPSEFVEQAIHELWNERKEKEQREQQELAERENNRKQFRSGLYKASWILGSVVALVFFLRGVEWLWFTLDMTPEEIVHPEPEVIVQERIIKETVLQTIPSSSESPEQVESRTPKSAEPSEKRKQAQKRPVNESSSDFVPKPPNVVKKEKPSLQESLIENVQSSKVETIEETIPQGELVKETRELIEPDSSKDAVVVETDLALSKIAKKIEGEWVLDAYLLYEKGIELPMEVPIVYEPLELPKTWRFSSGKYKRVMDADLSFSARYEVVSLPENLKAVVDEDGFWGQIVASNVVSTIPGIRRQNDYFAILLNQDSLTIWYLGPNAYRKKLPTQAERYRRQ